jgi:DNA-binding NarL/FixJ family response regulator
MSKKSVAQKKKRILIVDDHPMMRQGLVQLIGAEPDLFACGEAENAERALDMIGALKPDLVLADISLPGKNGLELIKCFQAIQPDLPSSSSPCMTNRFIPSACCAPADAAIS